MGRRGELVVLGVDQACAVHNPGKDRPASVGVEVVGVVLHVCVVFDDGVERDDDEPAPDACVHGSYTRQVIRVEHERVGGCEGEGCLVLFLRIDLIGGGELFDRRRRESHAFLGLGRDDEAFAFCLGEFGFDVPVPTDGEHVGGHVARIRAQDSGDRVPERGFPVASVPVSDHECFNHHTPNRCQADDPLNIGDQFGVALEEHIQGVLPHLRTIFCGVEGGLFREQIGWVVLAAAAIPQIPRPRWRVEQVRVGVELVGRGEQHRVCLFQGGADGS
ncbi:Uncharacterised protein [Chlamydia trachomatis]|nr:Uncharacterised protein [Chlamydia trachomatis]